ncbi:TolC family protein [Propionivibrio dicarboxylicus]|uniref:Outer membrane protein n=1 Tax=Propionivibrio dicarboxylicus TaxID=83767 RepID=A0A1G8F225_9RHOO|nr:TolC family protein [Propionivibrio dicarboxylicus]SDH76157.1 outer membrane protein [Propionivibrio dicarboxylicus]
MKRILNQGVWLLAGALLMPSAGAISLQEAWEAARDADPEFAAAQAEAEAGAKRRDQARALWLPSVSASAASGRANSQSTTRDAGFSAPGFGTSRNVDFQTSINNGTLNRWTVNAIQPLYSRDRLAQSRQLDAAADAADAGWLAARQAALLRTAERYFAVVQSETALDLARRQQVAVERARVEAQDRYRLGDKPIVDSHEATARAEAVRAQVLLAESDLTLQQQAFEDLVGRRPTELWRPRAQAGEAPGTLEDWLQKAVDGSPTLRMLSARLVAAQEEASRHGAAAAPSVDLVAQSGRERLAGSGDYGANALNDLRSSMIGVQVTIPIFTGGMRSARQEEALKLADKTRFENERARQQVEQSTRAAWLGVTVGATRVKALEANVKASLARLDATRLGHQVGDRTMLDLLNAENDASNAQLELLKARLGVILDRLRLAASAGMLDEALFETVSRSALARE